MPLHLINDKAIVYIHIPKCGGTSVTKCLLEKGRRALYYTGGIPGLKCSPHHMHGKMLERMLSGFSPDYVFTIIRRPLSRLESEYRYRADIAKKKNLEIADFKNWWHQTAEEYKRNTFVLDNHIRPQFEFICLGTEIFKQEDGLEKAIESVYSKIGIPETVPKTVARKSTEYEILWDKDLLNHVVAFYAEDFKAFDYDPAPLPKMKFE